MADVDQIGGIPVVLKELLKAGLLHGDCMTVTGYTVAENLSSVPSLGELQNVLYHVDKPLAPAGRHIIILKVCLFDHFVCTYVYRMTRNLQGTYLVKIDARPNRCPDLEIIFAKPF